MRASFVNDLIPSRERAAEMRVSSKELKSSNTAAVIMRLADFCESARRSCRGTVAQRRQQKRREPHARTLGGGWVDQASRVREVLGAILKKLRRMTKERPDVVRGPRRKPATKRMLICGNCGAEFLSSRRGAKWCSRSCQAYARERRGKAHHGHPRRPLQTLMMRRLGGSGREIKQDWR